VGLPLNAAPATAIQLLNLSLLCTDAGSKEKAGDFVLPAMEQASVGLQYTVAAARRIRPDSSNICAIISRA
jgi:hypothetical protein